MTLEENKRVVRRHFEEIFNEKKMDMIEEITAPDYREHGVAPFQTSTPDPTASPDGPESLRSTLRGCYVLFLTYILRWNE